MWINPRHLANMAELEPQSINESKEVMVNSHVDMNSHTWGFLEVGYPKIIHFNGIVHYRPSIWGYPTYGNPHMGITMIK